MASSGFEHVVYGFGGLLSREGRGVYCNGNRVLRFGF